MSEKINLSETKKKNRHIPMIWRDRIRVRQRNKCVGKDCAKYNYNKKKVVNNNSNFDHIVPIALGGKTILSNIQALCPKCHGLKLRENRYRILQAKKQSK